MGFCRPSWGFGRRAQRTWKLGAASATMYSYLSAFRKGSWFLDLAMPMDGMAPVSIITITIVHLRALAKLLDILLWEQEGSISTQLTKNGTNH